MLATLVEPCVQDARLVSCGQISQENRTQLSHLFDMSSLKRLYPYIASLEEFVEETAVGEARTFPTCMERKQTPACKSLTSCHKKEHCQALENALAEGEPTPSILTILRYYRGGFSQTKLADSKKTLIPPEDQVMQLKTQHMRFHQDHYAHVGQLLDTAGIRGNAFSVVHWRAELKGMNYL